MEGCPPSPCPAPPPPGQAQLNKYFRKIGVEGAPRTPDPLRVLGRCHVKVQRQVVQLLGVQLLSR